MKKLITSAISLLLVLVIRVAAQPTCDAHFTYNLIPPVNTVMFLPVQSPVATTYLWDFGDGTIDSSNSMTPAHTYPSAGTYYVCLSIARSDSGTCSDNWCDSVHVVLLPPPPGCNANFNAPPDTALNTIDFLSANNSATATYSWTFGDGNTSAAANPVYTYASPGTYYVCLTVSDTANGGCTDTQCDSIRVNLPPPPPACNAHFTQTVMFPSNHILFLGSVNSSTAYYSWTFGDGNTSNQATSVTNIYASSGTYYACLTVVDTNSSGTCTDTWCDSVAVVVSPPPTCDAHFTSKSVPPPNNIIFTPVQQAANSTFAWDFGDGNSSNQYVPVHLYASAGVYYVCLTVTDSDFAGKCTDTWCDSVHVTMPPPPACNAHFKANLLPNNKVIFISPFNPAGTTFAWDFGDGNTSVAKNPNHTFASSGVYNVCLTVSDSGKCSDTWCDSVNVGSGGPPPPTCTAQFTTTTMPGPHNIMFHAAQSPAGTTYHWDFGDGDSSASYLPVHQYASAGTYTVCLIVTRKFFGTCTDTWCNAVSARMADNSGTAQNANIVIYPNPFSENATLHLENTSGNVIFKMNDITGRSVLIKEGLGNGDFNLNKNDIVAGMYFYQVYDGDNLLSTGKLIVQ